MKKIFLFFVLFIMFLNKVNASDKVEVKYINMSSDDTLWVKENNKIRSIKIYGIKTNFSFSNEAVKYLDNLLRSAQKIEISSLNFENIKYNNENVLIYVDGELLEYTLIKNGIFQLSVRETTQDEFKNLCKEQNNAYKKRLGIWQDDETIELICHNKINKEDKDIIIHDFTKDKRVFPKNVLYQILFLNSMILLFFLILKDMKHEKRA